MDTPVYTIECERGDTFYFRDEQLHRDGDLPAIEYASGEKQWFVNGEYHREGDLPSIQGKTRKEWYKNGELHREGGLPAVQYGFKVWNAQHPESQGQFDHTSRAEFERWHLNGQELSPENALAYVALCKKTQEKKMITAKKKIYFWWIQICYDLSHPSGCGQRMAQKNLEAYEKMCGPI